MTNKVEKERCPVCAKRGLDTRGDNLAVYPDGHKWCFSCGYYVPTTTQRQIQDLLEKGVPDWRREELVNNDSYLDFPDDFTRWIPQHALLWLAKYGINNVEIIKHKLGWSEKRQLLVMPIFNDDYKLVMWQGRNFNTNRNAQKYITHGNPKNVIHVITPPDWYQQLTNERKPVIGVVVEDFISAIKVGRVVQCIPLWGSNMPLELIRKVSTMWEKLGVWLDPDKQVQAVKTAIRASQYIPSFVIASTQDPKDYDVSMITTFIEHGSRDSMWKNETTKDTAANTLGVPF